MPTLANINGASLVPDLSGVFKDARTDIRNQQAIGRAEQLRADTIKQTEAVTSSTGVAQQKALARLAALNPQAANSINSVIKTGNAEQRAVIAKEAEDGLRQATFISGLPDFATKQSALLDMAQKAKDEGRDFSKIGDLINLDEKALDLELRKMKVLGTDIKTLTAAPKAGQFSKGTDFVVRNDDGTTSIKTGVLNKSTGELIVKGAPVVGDIVSRVGETPAEESARKAAQSGKSEEAKLGAQLQGAPGVEAAKSRAKQEENRTQSVINRGLTAADSLPVVNRALDLLKSVDTGGFSAAKLRAKQLFGIESADEAELSAGLGKAVLSQLRGVFGAAFTEGEGRRLERIEAGFGKSRAGNLLSQAQKMSNRAANRAIKAALRTGDTDTADEIREAMSFTLTDTTTTPSTPGINPNAAPPPGGVFLGFE